MAIFDVVSASGKVISTITAGSEEAIYVGKAYGSDYLSQVADYLGEEVSIKLRVEVDFHEKDNKRIK